MKTKTWMVDSFGKSVTFSAKRTLRDEVKRAFTGERHRHAWHGWVPLEEKGISDVQGGRWGRVFVACVRCEEEREVFHGVDPTHPGMTMGCPGVGGERGRAGRKRFADNYNLFLRGDRSNKVLRALR